MPADVPLTEAQIASIRDALPTEPAAPDDSPMREQIERYRAEMQRPDSAWSRDPALRDRALAEMAALERRAGLQPIDNSPQAIATRQYDAGFQSLELGEGEAALVDGILERTEQLTGGDAAVLATMTGSVKAQFGDAYNEMVADADAALTAIFADMPDGGKLQAETRRLALASPHALRLLSARGQYLAAYRKGRPS